MGAGAAGGLTGAARDRGDSSDGGVWSAMMRWGWRRGLLVWVLCVAAATPAGAAGEAPEPGAGPASAAAAESGAAALVQLELHERARVTGREIRLGDVARLVEGEPSLWERLRGVTVGVAPVPGDVRLLSTGHIELRLRQARVDVRALRWAGSNRVVAVTGAGMAVDQELVRAAIERYLAERAPGLQGPWSRLSVGLVEWDASVQVAPGELSLQVVAGPPVLRPGPAVFSVELRSPPAPPRRVWVRALLEEPAAASADGGRLALEPTLASDGASGKEPEQVSAGAPLWLVVQRGAVSVAAPAVARSGGRVGDTIEAINTVSGASVLAVLVSPRWAVAVGLSGEAAGGELRR